MGPLQLRDALLSCCEDDAESWAVYFQPPNNLEVEVPFISFKRDTAKTVRADNTAFRIHKRYQVTIVTADPLSGVPDKVAALPFAEFERHFTSDNLNHDVYNLYA